MPALEATDHRAEVVWLGYVPHREEAAIETIGVSEMALDFGGFAADCHSGTTRHSCSRVVTQHPRGTEIANVRQLSIVSEEEMDAIARALELERIDPRWMGASIVLRGIADLTHLPPSARLQGPDGVTLVVDMENRPCQFPAMTIARDKPGKGKGFKEAAKGKRGVTAWVERPGSLALGEVISLHLPAQRAWRPDG